MPVSTLPKPDSARVRHSNRLLDFIKQRLQEHGAISFAEYMNLALYAPGLGYYSAGNAKLGDDGDFITAPEISPLFGQALTQQLQQLLRALADGVVLELGAGSGKLALDILLRLQQLNHLPKHYYILEISADLRERQQALLKKHLPHYFSNIIWLDSLPPSPIEGIILANEVLDAMPVHKFKWQDTLQEFYITWQNERLVWQLQNAASELEKAVTALSIDFAEGYESEMNLALPAWIKSLSEILRKGMILLIDYGYPRAEYYHPNRYRGTLMCHYQHRAHDNPLLWPGLQDITAHVDFTAIAEAAIANNLAVAGYTTQANFLLNCGITELVSVHDDPVQQWQQSQALKKLLLPSEMGELFKVIALTKAMDMSLVGFQLGDLRERL